MELWPVSYTGTRSNQKLTAMQTKVINGGIEMQMEVEENLQICCKNSFIRKLIGRRKQISINIVGVDPTWTFFGTTKYKDVLYDINLN